MPDQAENDACEGFDPHTPEFIADPYPTYEHLRARCPVAHSDRYMGGFWLITRYADVRAALSDWRTFTSSVAGVTAIPMITQRTRPTPPIELDPPRHTRYRNLVGPLFRRQRVEELEPALRAMTAGLIDPIVARGSGDLARELAFELSSRTLGLFLGLPDEDRPLWLAWVKRMHASVHDLDDARRATQEFWEYIERVIAERRRAPADDFTSFLLTAEIDGERLDPTEIRDFVHMTIMAGFETTVGAMGLTLLHLAEHPDVRRRLFAEPNLTTTAVEEFLRLTTPIQLFGRNAARDVELHGRRIPAGDVVAVAFAAANRDPDAFERPDECVLERSPNRHLAFGFGPHICLGAWVARLELRVLLEEVARRMPDFHVAPGAIIERKSRGDQIALESLPIIVGPGPA
jgi:cytochrome P450